MDKGKMIGRGKTAEVYEWGPGKVVKLFYAYTGENLSEHESNMGQAAYDAGVPAPRVYECVRTMGRNGLILERIPGNSMLKNIARTPWAIAHYARKMAGLHAKIHRCQSDKLVPQYDVIKSKIDISADVLGEKTEQICDYLAGLPRGTSICHGDFHPKNIFIAAQGCIAIDWGEACYGNGAADVARTALILASPHVPSDSGLLLLILVQRLRKKMLRDYLKEYLRLTGMSRTEINRWIVPVAAARLNENISGEKEWLMNIIYGRTELSF